MNKTLILEMKNIDKEFPGVKALQNVTFELEDGEIHGLVGENGAGKSTLMKVLAGFYKHDGGEIYFKGEEIDYLTPKMVEKLGIYFIHQERYFVPYLTVAESLFLGKEESWSFLRLVKKQSMIKRAEQILEEKVGLKVPGDKLISDLTVGELQLIQICRSLLEEPRVIVFDEPTAVLAQRETERLFDIIKDLKNKGIAIIYISHYLGEIINLCDRITVLRNGTKVNTTSTEGLEIEDIVYMIAGRAIEDQYPVKTHEIGELLLEVHDFTHKSDFEDIEFNLHKGEILGVTGLMGSGHNTLGLSIYNMIDVVKGDVLFEGKKLSKINPEKAVKLGIGYVPEDRRGLGIICNMSVKENISLASLNTVSKGNVINNKLEREKVDSFIERLKIKTPNQEEDVSGLSGGNQQKIVMAKWLSKGVKLYILNEPTAAVDVGAKAEIYALINQVAKEGAGVILISQDLQELVGMSNRILVMYRGKIIEEIDSRDAITDKVMISMMGGSQNESQYVNA